MNEHQASTCITCGDVAVPLTVESLVTDGAGGVGARCRAADGGVELVAVELVGTVRPGDRVLVHAGVALARLEPDPAAGREGTAP